MDPEYTQGPLQRTISSHYRDPVSDTLSLQGLIYPETKGPFPDSGNSTEGTLTVIKLNNGMNPIIAHQQPGYPSKQQI